MKLEQHPLELTVHSAPRPDEAMTDSKQTKYGRWKMLAIWLVCAAPVMASYFTFYVIKPNSTTSYGDIISPPKSIPNMPAFAVDKKPVQLTSLKGQWLLISVAGGDCNTACEQHLFLQRQLRESLGKDKDRLDWVWVVNDDAKVKEALKPALQAATVLYVAPTDLSQWLQPASGKQLSEHLYLVDPMGNWMMRFNTSTDFETAKKIKKDVERVLRASASWDKAGR
ncbi:MAG TPA: hypothetical protein PKC80_10875 [Burkholderiaceae bacterium]|nr:hypothetical protein [Burkholderiaceae bacterium]